MPEIIIPEELFIKLLELSSKEELLISEYIEKLVKKSRQV